MVYETNVRDCTVTKGSGGYTKSGDIVKFSNPKNVTEIASQPNLAALISRTFFLRSSRVSILSFGCGLHEYLSFGTDHESLSSWSNLHTILVPSPTKQPFWCDCVINRNHPSTRWKKVRTMELALAANDRMQAEPQKLVYLSTWLVARVQRWATDASANFHPCVHGIIEIGISHRTIVRCRSSFRTLQLEQQKESHSTLYR